MLNKFLCWLGLSEEKIKDFLFLFFSFCTVTFTSSFKKTDPFITPKSSHSEFSVFAVINYDSSKIACSSEILHLPPCFLSLRQCSHSSMYSSSSYQAPAMDQAHGLAAAASRSFPLVSICRMLFLQGFLNISI